MSTDKNDMEEPTTILVLKNWDLLPCPMPIHDRPQIESVMKTLRPEDPSRPVFGKWKPRREEDNGIDLGFVVDEYKESDDVLRWLEKLTSTHPMVLAAKEIGGLVIRLEVRGEALGHRMFRGKLPEDPPMLILKL